jgi:hypothetical protein
MVEHRQSLWDYYDRRVTERLPGLANAYSYWTGLGVEVEIEEIASETTQLEAQLRELSPGSFVDVGAGPGTFTRLLPGTGIPRSESASLSRSARNSTRLACGPSRRFAPSTS